MRNECDLPVGFSVFVSAFAYLSDGMLLSLLTVYRGCVSRLRVQCAPDGYHAYRLVPESFVVQDLPRRSIQTNRAEQLYAIAHSLLPQLGTVRELRHHHTPALHHQRRCDDCGDFSLIQ